MENDYLHYLFFSEDIFDEPMITTELPGVSYNVEVKLVDLGENFIVPTKGNVQYSDLSSSITDNFKSVFEKLPGYRRILVDNIKLYVFKVIKFLFSKIRIRNCSCEFSSRRKIF